MIIVKQEFRDFKTKEFGMLLPFGGGLHDNVLEAEIGDIVTSLDEQEAKIIAKSIVSINSSITNSLSKLIYGVSIKKLIERMEINWLGFMDTKYLLFLVVTTINEQATAKVLSD